MKNVFNDIMDKFGITEISLKRPNKKEITEKKVQSEENIIQQIMNSPEEFKLEAYIENNEIVVKLKKKS